MYDNNLNVEVTEALANGDFEEAERLLEAIFNQAVAASAIGSTFDPVKLAAKWRENNVEATPENLERARGLHARLDALEVSNQKRKAAHAAISLGMLHAILIRADKAREWFQKALEFEPENLEARRRLIALG